MSDYADHYESNCIHESFQNDILPLAFNIQESDALESEITRPSDLNNTLFPNRSLSEHLLF